MTRRTGRRSVQERRVQLLVSGCLFVSAAVTSTVAATPARAGESYDAVASVDPLFAAAKLRYYCKACHAVGDLKFIQSDDDAELWNSLFVNRAPHSGKLWADGILEVLDWPTDDAPPPDKPMDPSQNRDWMPKGAKRPALAADMEGGAPVREQIRAALQAGPIE